MVAQIVIRLYIYVCCVYIYIVRIVIIQISVNARLFTPQVPHLLSVKDSTSLQNLDFILRQTQLVSIYQSLINVI